jgi:hypothetical protein
MWKGEGKDTVVVSGSSRHLIFQLITRYGIERNKVYLIKDEIQSSSLCRQQKDLQMLCCAVSKTSFGADTN